MATLYVATFGSDSNAGTLAAPFRTFPFAGARMAPGDTLAVRGGIFGASSDVIEGSSFPNGTNWTTGSGAITVQNYNGETVWIKPSWCVYAMRLLSKSYHIWSGINFDGTNSVDDGSGLVALVSSDHVRLADLEIFNTNWSGIGTSDSSGLGTYYELLRVRIRDGDRIGGAVAAGHGIYLAGSASLSAGLDHHHLVDGCEVSGYNVLTYSAGIQVSGTGSADRCNGMTIRNCKLHGNSIGLILDSSTTVPSEAYNNSIYANSRDGVWMYADSKAKLRNNTIHGNAGWGVNVGEGYQAVDAVLTNNSISNNTSGPIKISNAGIAGQKATIDRNNLYANGNGNAILDQPGLSTITNTTTANPAYGNAAGGDFSIGTSSGLKDIGATIALITTDQIGTARPQGGAYDIGAFEYIAGGGGGGGTGALMSFVTIATANGATSASQNTTGATFLAASMSYSGGGTSPVLTDSKGNTWTLATPQIDLVNNEATRLTYVASATPIVGTGHTFTVTGTSIFASVVVAWFNGMALTGTPLENGTYATAVTSLAPGAISPSVGDLVLAALGTDAAVTSPVAAGLTLVAHVPYVGGTNYGGALAWGLCASVPVNPTWSWTTLVQAAVAQASFASSSGITGTGSVVFAHPTIAASGGPSSTAGVAFRPPILTALGTVVFGSPPPVEATGGVAKLLPARSGIARSGRSRSGYLGPIVPLGFALDGVTRSSQILIESMVVSLALNEERGTCRFTMKPDPVGVAVVHQDPTTGQLTVMPVPSVGTTITIDLGGTGNRIFAGQIARITRTRRVMPSAQQTSFIDVECVDWSALFDRQLITRNFPAQSPTLTAQSIVAAVPGFTARNVALGLPAVEAFPCINEPPMSALRRLVNERMGGGGVYIDAYKDVHLFPATGETGPNAPSNPVSLANVLPTLHGFAYTIERSQLRNRVEVEGQATTCPIDMDVGATTFPVVDAEPFINVYHVRVGTERVTSTATPVVADVVNLLGYVTDNAPGAGAPTLGIVYGDFPGSIPAPGWIKVGSDQYIRYTGYTGTGPAYTLTGIPTTGMGSIAQPIATDPANPRAAVFHWQDYLSTTALTEAHPAGTDVTLIARADHLASQAVLATLEGGDGIHVFVLSDNRLGFMAAYELAAQEVGRFGSPTGLVSLDFDTDDMNAKIGARQAVNFTTPDPVSVLLTITHVELTWPVKDRRPMRHCRASLVILPTTSDLIFDRVDTPGQFF